MYQNFINLTEGIKNKANKLIYMFQFPINLPNFYTPDKSLIDTLRVVVSAAEGNTEEGDDQKLNDVTNKLKISMENGNGSLAMEIKDEDQDKIQAEYFDVDIPDVDVGAQSSVDLGPMSVPPEEEFKMDKDLDLFEMINKGDFSTVGGSKGAAAANN